MKKFVHAIALLLCLVLAFGLAACGSPAEPTPTPTASTPSETEPSAPSDEITIGFSVYDMQYEFFQNMEKGTREAVEALGWKYVLHDEKSSEQEMVTGAINLINSGVSALIISPCKPEALSSIVAAAKEKNIPVIVDDIGGGGTDYNAIVISNCYHGGQLGADYTVELLAGNEGSKKVAIIKCEPEAVYAIRRGEGYKANITAAGFEVVAEISGHSKSEEGYSIMQDLLASNPDIVAVFAENDPMAVGAANAIADAGRNDIVVIGFNNDPEAVDAMKSGIMAATVAQFPELMGQKTVELAQTLLSGGTIAYDDPSTREVFAEVKLIKAGDVA
ncbi:MAG: substrate-binding domain-containing protein [Oscillospiraceae bacterium]|nr:substrate-binding domain-containing protein [Oscillospiraceae bacterium]